MCLKLVFADGQSCLYFEAKVHSSVFRSSLFSNCIDYTHWELNVLQIGKILLLQVFMFSISVLNIS